MHPRPPKSAPGRIKSTKISLNDIEEWVLQDTMLAQEKTRHSGHPPENITEERLLKTRLIEMGKERFKVLARLTSERQSFIDRQKRKAYITKRSRDEKKPVRIKSASSSLRQRGENGTEMPPLDMRQDVSKLVRPKTVQFQTNMRNSGYLTTPSDVRPHTVAITPRNHSTTLMSTDTDHFMLDMGAPVQDSHDENTTDLNLSRTSSDMTRFSRSASLLNGKDILYNKSTASRNVTRPVSITREPRYAMLEAALSQTYAGHCKLDVRTIIERSESLQRGTRFGGLDAKKALQEKIKHFMFEKDFSFKYLLV